MSVSIQSANVYADLQSLDRLKHSGGENEAQTLRFVAEQFEAMFMQMMLKSAREFDTGDEGLFDSEQSEFYQDWHDKQMAIHLSSGRGIGIADMLVEQLRRQGGPVTAQAVSPAESPQAPASHQPFLNQVEHLLEQQKSAPPAIDPQSLDSPEAFVKSLYPLAHQGAARLGTTPEMLLAQAALETGWGRKISRGEHGESSYNLFNIKADHRWQGKSVSVPTLEYRDGIAVREQARFRAYDSFAASFDDYVQFIQDSPRYRGALSLAYNDQAYSHGLARAGYATDPEYASKIMNIVRGDNLNNALAAIKI